MICPSGQSEQGSGACKMCPRGTYKPEDGIGECFICGDGYYTKREGATSKQECIGKHYVGCSILAEIK